MQIMVNRVNVNRVRLLGHLIDDRNINEELIGRQNGLHTIHTKPILWDNDNPVDSRLGVRTLEYRRQTLNIQGALHLGRAEQHKFIRAGKRRHMTRIIPGADELERVGPRADLTQHVARLSLGRPHVVKVVVHMDTPIPAQLRVFHKLMTHGLEKVNLSRVIA